MLSKEQTKESLNNVADELNRLCRLIRNVGLIINDQLEITEETKKELAKTISSVGELFHGEEFKAITSAYHYLTSSNTVKADFSKTPQGIGA